MKVSVNWMQYYCDKYANGVKILPPGGIDELVEKIGAQLGAVEEVQNIGDKYKGIVLAKIVTCEPHPNANKLSLCKIDDGGKVAKVKRDSKGHVQVVCGAPNAREGLLVAWLPPGATVPSSYNQEPLVLEAREIRGEVSNGMIASAHELGISDDHTGIVELNPTDGKPGDDFAKTYNLSDYVIAIENKMFTHRPDCFGMLGVAREIAGITGQPFSSPDVYLKAPTHKDQGNLKVALKNEIPKLVPRFTIQVFEDVQMGQSPLWLQTYLSRVGLRPINNVVDITNYFMLLTGQPLHAYDYDKVKALSGTEANITVRYPRKGEKVKLLNGKEIEPRKEAIMIATDKQLIGIGGVMGGSETEVDRNTKNIILECANFDMFSIRRTSMEHGLFTDAVTRFSKGQSPLQCDRVLAWAGQDVTKLAGGTPGKVYDHKHALKEPAAVKVSVEFINERLGSDLSVAEMAKLLVNVEFAVKISSGNLTVQPPFWRTDIEIPEDVVEEVGRLHGYDKLPTELPLRSAKATPRNASLDFKTRIRQLLSAAGANEVLTYSFVHGDLLQKASQDPKHAYELTNAISPDLQYYRLGLLPSLLDKVHPNIKAGVDEMALFEMNPTHNKLFNKGDLPDELSTLALVCAANDKTAHPGGAAYFQAKHYLTALLDNLGVQLLFQAFDKAPEHPGAQPFEAKRSAHVIDARSGKILGVVGEFKASVRRSLKLPAYVAGFELNLHTLQKSAVNQKPYVNLPKFPKVQQDVSLRLPAKISYQELYELIWAELNERKPKNTLLGLGPIDIYQRDKDHQHKQITLRLTIAAFDRTLRAEEVNSLLDEVATAAHQKFGAERL